MGKRGPKSAADMAVAPPVDLRTAKQRPPAPQGLDEDESAIWRRVVGSMPADWFKPEHREMLARYCEHQRRAERFSKVTKNILDRGELNHGDIEDLDKACKMAERESRAALALARSMRLTHQAQIRAETASTKRQNATATPPPWWDADWDGGTVKAED